MANFGVDSNINIQDIDMKTKYIIFGFIKRYQKILNQFSNDSFYTIPELVSILCILYYDRAMWFEDTIGKSITINGATATSTSSEYRTVYGAQLIKNGKHEWEITIDGVGHDGKGGVGVGISSNTNYSNHYFMYNADPYSYCYWASGNKYVKSEASRGYGIGYKSCDVIGVEVNLYEKTIQFSKNGSKLPIITNLHPTSYRIAVTSNMQCIITMISYHNKSNENKIRNNKKMIFINE
eukprot:453281_1